MASGIFSIMQRLKKLEKGREPTSEQIVVIYRTSSGERKKIMSLADATREIMNQSTYELFKCKPVDKNRIIGVEYPGTDGFLESLLEEPTMTIEELQGIVEE